MITISLEGIQSPPHPETRAIAILKVDYDGNIYDWQVYIPENNTVSLEQFLIDIAPTVQQQIDTREAEWAALDPKTKEIEDPFGEGTTTVPIEKTEIVRPYMPDYFAQRRSAYPSVDAQIGALWKGNGSSDYMDMLSKIQTVKDAYPKEMPADLESYRANIIESVNEIRNLRRNAKKYFADLNAYFDANEVSLTNIQASFNMALASTISALPFSVDFTDADNVTHTMDSNTVLAFGSAVFTEIGSIYIAARTVKDQILAATTKEEIDTLFQNYKNAM